MPSFCPVRETKWWEWFPLPMRLPPRGHSARGRKMKRGWSLLDLCLFCWEKLWRQASASDRGRTTLLEIQKARESDGWSCVGDIAPLCVNVFRLWVPRGGSLFEHLRGVRSSQMEISLSLYKWGYFLCNCRARISCHLERKFWNKPFCVNIFRLFVPRGGSLMQWACFLCDCQVCILRHLEREFWRKASISYAVPRFLKTPCLLDQEKVPGILFRLRWAPGSISIQTINLLVSIFHHMYITNDFQKQRD